MSEKNCDCNNRWRNVTIAFRVSPEENASINMRVKLSGLTKQEYICRRCQQKDIVVMGNSRIYKALKDQMVEINSRLVKIAEGTVPDCTLQETIHMTATTLSGFANENNKGGTSQ